MAGRPPGQPPSHSENLIDFDDHQPSYYSSGARPPVNDDELLHRYDIDNTDTPQGRPSVSYDDFVGGGRPAAGLPGGPGTPTTGDMPYSMGGSRLYSQTSDLNNYQRYSDADIPPDDDHSAQGYYAGSSYDSSPGRARSQSNKANRSSLMSIGGGISGRVKSMLGSAVETFVAEISQGVAFCRSNEDITHRADDTQPHEDADEHKNLLINHSFDGSRLDRGGGGAEQDVLALVIDGKSLTYALERDLEKEFLDLAVKCKAVICCRVSPLQKALVVKLVKRHLKAILLAIGDGANDVSMIQAAHVGIGISGMEGLQAARSADISIGQFRYLRKLLLVHGAWSYQRISKVILYSFYKNIALFMTQFWYSGQNAFSGQIIYESWTLTFYNVFFTAAPPFVLGIFDQYVSARLLDRYPQLYRLTQSGVFFKMHSFWSWVANGFYHSLSWGDQRPKKAYPSLSRLKCQCTILTLPYLCNDSCIHWNVIKHTKRSQSSGYIVTFRAQNRIRLCPQIHTHP